MQKKKLSNETVDLKDVHSKSGNRAIVLGVGVKKKSRVKSSESGVFKKTGVPRLMQQFSLEGEENYQAGDQIGIDFFEGVRYVDVRGISISKGFQGVIKRYGMRGGPSSHGSHFHRRPGSIGATTYPARVWKGKKMPGRMGGKQVCVQSVEVVKVDKENGALLIKGSIPGNKKNYVYLTKALKR